MAFRPTSGPMWGPILLFGLFEKMQNEWAYTTQNSKPFYAEILRYFTNCSLPNDKIQISVHPGLKKALFGREAIIQSRLNFFSEAQLPYGKSQKISAQSKQ